jgi:hypothetical protein
MNWFERMTSDWRWPTLDQVLTSLREQWVVWIVWFGLFLATILILRMLVTRWGQKNEIQKALGLSILLHTVVLLYSTTLPLMQGTLGATQPERVSIRHVVLTERDNNPSERSATGRSAVWDRLPDTSDDSFDRLDKSPADPLAMSSPDRKASDLPDTQAKVPDLPDTPTSPPVDPTTVTSAQKTQVTAEANPTKIPEETAEARPGQALPSSNTSRQPRAAPGVAASQVERMTREGNTESVGVKLNPLESLATSAVPVEPDAKIPRGQPVGLTQPRLGPLPSKLLEDDDAGAVSGKSNGNVGSGSPTAKPFARLGGQRSPDNSKRVNPDSPSRLASSVGTAAISPDAATANPLRVGPKSEGAPLDEAAPRPTRADLGLSFDKKAAQQARPYELRTPSKRKEAAAAMGATDASERAVEMGLQWLALHQSADGSWDADGFAAMCPAGDVCRGHSRIVEYDATAPFELEPAERARLSPDQLRARLAQLSAQRQQRQVSGLDADAGLTGLAVLAFLGAGYTHEEGIYADTVDRALRWLVRQQAADGFLGGKAAYYARMYCHGMASIALGEAYGMTSDSTLREPLAAAIRFIVSTQNSDGSWRYSKGTQGDMSIFGWQLMALKSAATAGIDVPQETLDRTITFLKNAGQGRNGGLAGYRAAEQPKPSMTAEALFCRQMVGMKRTNPASIEAAEFLLQHPPRRAEPDLYYWYYGTLAMYQYGGQAWRTWNEALRDSLVVEQRSAGHSAGSWDPRAPWGDYGGRVYSTAMSTLSLEVYYRFLPLYQMGGKYEDAGR